MKRKIYDDLLKWKTTGMQEPLMLIGARQIGKTYIIREFCRREFENYIEINLFDEPEIIKIFSQNISTLEKFNRMKIYLDKDINIQNTIIFFDEVQESEEVISALKFFNESEDNYKIICAGSLLGVKLKRMKTSFPVGKVKLLNMYPMDFEEFLMANGNDMLIDEIYKCYNHNYLIDEVLHDKCLSLYYLYLCVGGMPRAVENLFNNNKDILKFDKTIIRDIIESYLDDMNRYVENKNEAVKIEAIYRSIPRQLGNTSGKFQYSKVLKEAREREYLSSLEWLLSSTMVLKCLRLNKVEVPPLAFTQDDYFKLYLSDIGILVNMLNINYNDIILDKLLQYKGVLAENYVANSLMANRHDLIFWNSGNLAEIDFVIYTDDGLIPIEVKGGNNTTSKSLGIYMKKYNPSYGIRISTKNFGYNDETKIKSIPLYATFCIKK